MGAKKHSIYLSLTLFFFLSWNSMVFSQYNNVKNYSISDGLVQNTIHSIIQDSKDRIWIGTAEGFSIYDGTEFLNYPPTQGLKNPVINCFLRIGDHYMLLGTNGAGVALVKMNKYEYPKIIKYIHGKRFLTNDEIYSFYKDTKNNLWICTNNGLTEWKDFDINKLLDLKISNSVKFYNKKNGLPGNSVQSVIETQDKTIWVGTNKGINKIVNGKLIHSTMNISDRNLDINYLMIYKENKFLIATKKKVLIFDGGKLLNFSDKIGLPNIYVNTMMRDSKNNYWFGTNTGLYQYDGKRIQYYSLGDNYASKLTVSLIEDNEGNIWVGTLHGVYKIQRSNFLHIKGSSDLEYISSIKVDKNNNVWVTGTKGLFKLKNNRIEKYQLSKAIASLDIRCLYFDKKGRMWIGTENGLYYKNPGSNNFILKNGIKNKSIVSIIELPNGIYWVGTDNGFSVFKMSNPVNQKDFIFAKDICSKLPDKPARSLYQDRNNDLWIGFLYDGLYKISKNKLKHYTSINGLTIDNIRCIFGDSKNHIWIGTRYHGLLLYKNGNFVKVTKSDSSSLGWISTIIQDQGNNYWFGTAKGLLRYDNNNWLSFDENDGITSGEITAAAIDSSGRLWFGSFNGIYRCAFTNLINKQKRPKIYIKRIQVNGTLNSEFSKGKLTSLPYNKNNIEFDFAGVWFKNEGNVYYRYKLDGLDKNWSRPVKSNAIHYQNLDYGKYKFEVIAKNSDGVWSKSPAKVAFIIESPVWLRWWFLLSAVIILTTIVYLILNYRLKRIIELERLKTRIASDLHDDVGATLSRISLISELIKENIEPNKIKQNLIDIGNLSREALNTMSDIVWSMDTRNDNLQSMINRIKDSYAATFRSTDIYYKFDQGELDGSKKISSEVRKNIYLIAKESLSNIIKHSNATEVFLDFRLEIGILKMIIKDNGKWDEENKKLTGNGIRNMKMRAEDIKGSVELNRDNGTEIIFTMKF